ncbi:MAG TPA: tryptophan halogenase family protein [Pseudomonadales bacterium]|nr:tryptophan halogenase family protein [Pseudomonadales bacterium]
MEGAGGPLREIVIVGGGTAGWMSALWLARSAAFAQARVTLVEAPDIGTVGVGEATVPTLLDFLDATGIGLGEVVRECGATLKYGIRFEDWHRPGEHYWHPFGAGGGSIDGIPVFQHWLRLVQGGVKMPPLSAYARHVHLAERGLGHRPLARESGLGRQRSYALHLDAGRFAALLRTRALAAGVTHLRHRVDAVETRADGAAITRLRLDDGPTLSADLFVDCTGFAARLHQGALDGRFEPCETLLCDRAVVAPLPEDPAPAPFTRSIAQRAGWIWRIPLGHRTGCGHVHASAFESAEGAVDRLVAVTGVDPATVTELSMRVGWRPRPWLGNCVAIGLAAGFTEPLESTGIHLVQRGLELLSAYAPDRGDCSARQAAYNARMCTAFEEVRDFLLLHYVLSAREEPFWVAARAVDRPDTFVRRLALFAEAGLVDPEPGSLFRASSWCAVHAGNGHLPRAAWASLSSVPEAASLQGLDEIRRACERLADAMPSHRALLDALAAVGPQKDSHGEGLRHIPGPRDATLSSLKE